MMAKLKFQPNPTFKLLVSVPIAGQSENDEITFTVKHLLESEYEPFVKEGVEYLKFAEKIVTAWDMDKEFNAENLAKLFDCYPQLGRLLFIGYYQERYKTAEKN